MNPHRRQTDKVVGTGHFKLCQVSASKNVVVTGKHVLFKQCPGTSRRLQKAKSDSPWFVRACANFEPGRGGACCPCACASVPPRRAPGRAAGRAGGCHGSGQRGSSVGRSQPFAARGSARGRAPGPGRPGATGLGRRGGVIPDHRRCVRRCRREPRPAPAASRTP